MKKNRYIILLAISFSFLLGISFLLIPKAHADSQIPSNYSQNLDLDKTYIYNVSGFDSKVNFYDYLDFLGEAESNDGGIIGVNFTDFYEKNSSDTNAFSNPVPYINISFWKNHSNDLMLNNTFSNVSSSSAAYNLAMTFNDFRPGFLIPTSNITSVIQKAEDEEIGNTVNGTVETQEFKYLSMLEITFKANDTSQNTTLIYNTNSGILKYCEIESEYGPDFGLELFEITDFEKDEEESNDDGAGELNIPGYSVVFLVSLITLCSGIVLLRSRRKVPS